jgi:hypothetical protein
MRALLPSSLPPLARLLMLAPGLIATWYGALRLTNHPLVSEVHQLASGARGRVARLVRAS